MLGESAFESTLTKVPKPRSREDLELAITESGEREVKAPTFAPVDLESAIKALKPEEYFKPPTKGRERTVEHFELLAEGGEHLVFEFDDPKHRNVVYKVNFHQTLPVLERLVSAAREKDVAKSVKIAHEAATRELQEQIEHRKDQVTILRDYFGQRAVPVQRLLVREVPVSREVIRQLRPSAEPEGEIPPTIPAWVSIQRRLAIDPERTVMLQGYYPEAAIERADEPGAEALALYDKGHDLLVGRRGTEDMPHEEQESAAIGMYPKLKAVKRRMADPKFSASLRETTKRLVDFTNETGMPLDVVGKNNVFLFEGEQGWEVKMPDALYPELHLTMSDLSKFADELERDKGLDIYDSVRAMNLLNTVRYVNALAIVAGIPDRVAIPKLKMVPGYVWREALVKKPRKSSEQAAAFEKTAPRPETPESEVPW